MDRQTLYRYLAQADDHIDQATERLERHSRMLEQIKLAGRDTSAAEELMARFERALEGIRSDRRVILDLLEAIKGRRRKEEALEPRTDGTIVVQMNDTMYDASERWDEMLLDG